MKRSVRSAAAIVATGLVLVACGTADEAAPATEAVAVTAAPEAGGDTELTPDEGSATEGTTAAPAVAGAETAAADTEPAATQAPPTDAPAAEAVIGGRAFASELAAESDFAENLLPDLLVDDIRSGQKINLRNVFPAERPVLIWAWAPH